MKVWMIVTPDEYELPLSVADTATELGTRYGVNISNLISRATACKSIPCGAKRAPSEQYRVRVIEIDECAASFGTRLRHQRERRNMTLMDLAFATGINPRVIKDWENDKYTPKDKSMKRLTAVISEEDLLEDIA